jgi:hypothetical protein
MAAILNHLNLGHGGSKNAVFMEYLLNFACFPDLTQGKATIDKKSNNATLEEKVEINGEIYVLLLYLVILTW